MVKKEEKNNIIDTDCKIKCPVRKNYGPVRKNHEMRHFAYKNTYNEAIFDLWQKKSMLKSGIPDMISENRLLVIDPLIPNHKNVHLQGMTWFPQKRRYLIP